MEFDKKTLRYFKYKFSRGRNTLAQLLDKIFGSLLGFVVLFCVFWAMHAGLWRSAILSATVVTVFDIFLAALSKYRLGRFILNELWRIRQNYMLERLTMLSGEEFSRICREIFLSHSPGGDPIDTLGGLYFPDARHFCYAFSNHPENPVGVQQMLVLNRKLKKLRAASATVLTAAKYMNETSTMSKRLGAEITLLGRNEFFPEDFDYITPPSEEELQNALQAEISVKPLPGRIKGAFLAPRKTRAYVACAAFLICWYLIAGFGIFYPIAAAVCIALAVLSYLAGKKSDPKVTVE